MNPSAQQSLNLLRDSLIEAQTTARADDTKAQIVGVGFILALGVIGKFEGLLPRASELNLLTISVASSVILPIFLFGFVLYPTRKSAEKIPKQSEIEPNSLR